MVLSRALPFALIACATAPSAPSVTAEQSIALAFLIDGPEPKNASKRVAVSDQLAEKLNCTNYDLKLVKASRFDGVRSKTERLQTLKTYATSDWMALIEVNPRYLNPSAGRYRWEIAVQVSIANKTSGQTIVSKTWNLAAHLTRSNQDAIDALDAVLDEIAERLTLLLRRTVNSNPQPPTAKNTKPRLFYLALVDRFADADPSNNQDVDRLDPQAWHGGDLAGVTRHIPHLKALGVTDVWLTPIFSSRSKKFHGHGAFHGYWTHDLGEVDGRFGGLSAAKELRQATRAAGIKLHLDLVTNHVAWDSPLRQAHPEWFHPDQAITDPHDAKQREIGWVHGLPDLAQERPAVSEYLIGHAKRWQQELQPDGYRLDALTHVPAAFIRSLAGALGSNVELLGEIYDGRAHVLSERWNQTGLKSAFDFPSHFALLNSICDEQPMQALASVLALDRLYQRPEDLLIFVDNHDLPRVLSRCGNDQLRTHLALSVLFALRGTPVITYGTESGLAGKGEPENRADMVFDTNHPTFAHVQSLVARRAAHPLLATGKTEVLHVDADQLQLLRYDAHEALLVAINKGRSTQSIETQKLPRGLKFQAPNQRVEVAGQSVVIVRLKFSNRPTFSEWLSARQTTRSIRLVTSKSEGRVVAVGSAPELGSWEPTRAVELKPQGDVLVGTVELPAASVVAIKLARVSDTGTTWSQQANHYFMPSSVDGDLELKW